MSVRKDKKNGKWTVDISTQNITTGKRKRIVRKNIDSKQKALELEFFLRMTKLNQKGSYDCNIKILFAILIIEDQQRERKKAISKHKNIFLKSI